MNKWIVFISIVHEEMTIKADLHSEGKRSVATYPLLAVPTEATAELVVARLNHLHGVPEDSGADDWQEFSFKADSELTPQEVAIALELSDPSFSKNERHPSWLEDLTNAAQTAFTDVSRWKQMSVHSEGGAYLFVGSKAETTPSTVFYRTSNASNAETLCRLFTQEYSSNGTPDFYLRTTSSFAPEDQVLLDDAIDELAIYDDPDPWVYDPPASQSLLERAEYSRRADRWEAKLKCNVSGDAPTDAKPTSSEVLVFIADPAVHFGDTRRVIPPKGAVVAIIQGRTLAEAVAGMYRVEHGNNPLPLAIVDCSALSIVQLALAKRELSRAESIGSNLGSDGYSTTDPVFARIGGCAMDLSQLADELRPVVEEHDAQMQPPSVKVDSTATPVELPDPQSVADVVVLFMMKRDLIQISRDYPDAIPESDQKDWIEKITAHTDLALNGPGFDDIKTLMKSPGFLDEKNPECFGLLMSAVLFLHPAMVPPAGSSAENQTAIEKAMSICQETASPHVKVQISRLADLMVVSCRCPTDTSVKEFTDPARFFQLLQRYWSLASVLVHTQMTCHVGFSPHPLLNIIENIRDRLTTCFLHVLHLEGADDARESCEQLLGVLTEGDIDDLSAVPEWTNDNLQNVERFIARARLKIGSRVFELTGAEDFFIKRSEHQIAEHDKRCRAAWKQVLARTDAQTAARKPPEESPTPIVSNLGHNPVSTPEHRVAKIEPLLSSLVAVDNGIMSLGAQLRSLSCRGRAANSQALSVQVKEQLHKWIDPILQHLKDAESASNGVGAHLVGFLAEPLAWEVDTRVSIRSLSDHLVGLIYSNGDETEESIVVGAASELCSQGQRLQAVFEALNVQTVSDEPHKSPNAVKIAPKIPPTPFVVLGRAGDPCTVNGISKKALTHGQHAVVAALIDAGDEGLKKDSIEAVRSSARRMLGDLRKDADWALAIIMPGQTNGRYRIPS